MIEKILEKFEELKVNDVCVGIPCSECEKRYGKNCDKAKQSLTIDKCKAIVQEVAKEYAEIARESREDFMEIVYSELEEDADNNRANRIIDAFDIYAPYQKEAAKDGGKDTNVPSNGWIPVETELPPMPKENPLFEYKPLELYLVTVKSEDYPFRAFWNGKFFTDGWGKVDVIAWQPLPAPYQKGE